MAFGQYSAGGGRDASKRDLVERFDVPDPKAARKPGKNRLHWTNSAGEECYSLHSTIVARLSADRKTLTLDDGGWATLTTRAAMGEACSAFGLGPIYVRGHRGDHHFVPPGKGYFWDTDEATGKSVPTPHMIRFARTVAIALPDWTVQDAPADCPMIRANSDDGEEGSLEVRFTGSHVVSSAGPEVPASPFKVLLALEKLLAFTKANRHHVTPWRDPIYGGAYITLFGYGCYTGRMGSLIAVGCHHFKTRDVRAAYRRIREEHPDAAKKARKAHLACQRRMAKGAKASTASAGEG